MIKEIIRKIDLDLPQKFLENWCDKKRNEKNLFRFVPTDLQIILQPSVLFAYLTKSEEHIVVKLRRNGDEVNRTNVETETRGFAIIDLTT